MTTVDVLVIGAGPGGLAAALEAGSRGLVTVLSDANLQPGGQLTKQIHRFFGSTQHRAGTRGVDIAAHLRNEVLAAGVQVWTDSPVYELSGDLVAAVARGVLASAATRVPGAKGTEAWSTRVAARGVIIATGASENTLCFPGWTLPGVMGAGAAQTMVNVHRVLPGRRVLMVGAGNVGLIVSYQLRQAGADVVAVVEALPRVGGYYVHAAKVARMGIPILTSHSVVEAWGDGEVRGAVVAPVDSELKPQLDRAREVEVDTICVATGLRPNAHLAWMAGCRGSYVGALGGWLPWHDDHMTTTTPGLFVAGDVAGVEEASTALDEGRMAGLSVAVALGAVSPRDAARERESIRESLLSLRQGPFGEGRERAKQQLIHTKPVALGLAHASV